MRILLILAAAPLAVSAAAAPPPSPAAESLQVRQTPEKRECFGRADVYPVFTLPPSKMQRLGELPPGQLILAIQRKIDDCPVPVVVGEPFGFDPQGFYERTPKRR